MSRPLVLGLSGSLTRPSRTTALVRHVVERIAAQADVAATVIELAQEAHHLFGALAPGELRGRAREVVDAVERADLLVVGSPVYRASYTGAFKHLFDLVHHQAFAGKPVVLTATGGSPLHGLVTEHQLRPLFGFLGALTLPTTVYAVEGDFRDHRLASPRIEERAGRAADEAARQLAEIARRRAEPPLRLAVGA